MKLNIKDYLVIPAFAIMPIEDGGLGLKGNEAIVFSLIYSFSKDGESWFQGSQAYLAAWCGGTTRTVRNVLTSLLSKELIEKRERKINNNLFFDYKVADKVSQLSTHRKNFPTPQEKSSHHNIEHNITPLDIDSNESISIPPKGKRSFVKPSIEDIIAYCVEHDFETDPYEFYDHYESNGWSVGKAKMKNWVATLRNWERRRIKGERR